MKKGATIGANATLICGHNIGSYATVGVGCVVAHNVDDYSLVVGNPDKLIGYVCECGCQLNKDFKCLECGKEYEMLNNYIINRGGGYYLSSILCCYFGRRAA